MNFSLNSRVAQFSGMIAATTATNFSNNAGAIEVELEHLFKKLLELKNNNKSLYIVGNGGSAGVAAHAVTDFFNVAKIRAFTLHESSLLTCMANDFGYENAVARMLDQLLSAGDMVITISSSGNSMNMQNAATVSKGRGAFVLTLSGFSPNNPLRSLGDMNLWIDSCDYGLVEIGHQFILHNLADRFNDKLRAQFNV